MICFHRAHLFLQHTVQLPEVHHNGDCFCDSFIQFHQYSYNTVLKRCAFSVSISLYIKKADIFLLTITEVGGLLAQA